MEADGKTWDSAAVFGTLPANATLHKGENIFPRIDTAKELAELERECPEDYRAWAEYRGGELRHGAETKAAVGERGRAALEEWSFSAGADTDLYVFSHGSWIAQTVQTVLGLGAIHPDFADVVSMGNAHWVRFVAADMPDGTLRWRLVDYNHGPALADTDQWEHPAL